MINDHHGSTFNTTQISVGIFQPLLKQKESKWSALSVKLSGDNMNFTQWPVTCD